MNNSLEISSPDIIKIILQFLAENNLHSAFDALTIESKVSLNSLENSTPLVSAILSRRWDECLLILQPLALPPVALTQLYHHILLDLHNANELPAARSLLRDSNALSLLRDTNPELFMYLQDLISKPPSTLVKSKSSPEELAFQPPNLDVVAADLVSHIDTINPSRLLTLLGQAIKWQHHQGLLSPDMNFDLFKGTALIKSQETDSPTNVKYNSIKFSKKQHPETVIFSPDGQYFVTGTIDGFIEVWNYMTGKLRKDLKYQADDEIMLMESAVLCSTFSLDSSLLATGDKEGKIAVWKILNGVCYKRFPNAHIQGVTSLRFNLDASKILSTSFDFTIKIHGMKSGKVLKEFRGHTSFVNDALYSTDYSKIMSGSSDGTIKIWDVKSVACLHTFNIFNGKMAIPGIQSPAITKLILNPKNPNQVIVSDRSLYVSIVSFKAALVKSMKIEKNASDFVSAAVSTHGDYIYSATENGHLAIFHNVKQSIDDNEHQAHIETPTLSYKEISFTKINERENLGILHHPASNILAVYDEDGTVNFYK